jgi:tetratricopeptide (TPR) repeat protein
MNSMKKRILFVVVYCLGLNSYAQDEKEQMQARYVKIYQQGRYREAIKVLDSFLVKHPDDAMTWLDRAVTEEMYYDYRGALRDYKKVVQLEPDAPDGYFLSALLQDKLGWYKEAVRNYTETVRCEPSNADAYCFRGIIYKRWGKIKEAEADFNRAIKERSSHDEAYAEKGLVALERKQFALAEQYLKLSETYFDGNAKTQLYLGWYYAQTNQAEKALFYFEKCLTLNPYQDVFCYWGTFKKTVPPSLLNALHQQMEQQPNNAYLGLVAVYLKDFAAGKKQLELTRQEHPDNWPLLDALAQALYHTQKKKEAAAIYENYLASHPNSIDGYLAYAQLFNNQLPEKIKVDFQKALALQPDHTLYQEAYKKLQSPKKKK